MTANPGPIPRRDLIAAFANHRVACNLLMAIMLLAGGMALTRLNTQFFPNFSRDIITVQVPWTGAAAEDIEEAIVGPIERELLGLGGVREITSTASQGGALLIIKYEEGTDLEVALDELKERVASIRNLPATAEVPVISRAINYEPVAQLLVTGGELRNLRPIVRRIERELLKRGIAKIDISGLPQEEIAIQVATAKLRELDMSLPDIADRIAALSRDLPTGNIGRDNVSKQLRALEQQRREAGFELLPLSSDDDGRLLTLGDIATVERRPRSSQIRTIFKGRPAVTMRLSRAETSDSIEAANILHEWIEEQRDQWPPGVEVLAYDESWELIQERTLLLLENGATGLFLVVAVLFLFLNGRVAFWVAVGIPVSFMAALAVLYLVGGSINMISLFGLMMALGIIVDDAIVVGEDALTQYQTGAAALVAADGGARRMFTPVMASSLTTVATFIPLMLVSGTIGRILFDIPLVVICVIAASLIESFLILPGHLHHSFRSVARRETGAIRRRLDRGFEYLRDHTFRSLVMTAVAQPWITLSCALGALLLTVGLIAGERIAFTFFPSPEGKILYANASFVAGTPPARVEQFMAHLERTLGETEAHFDEALVDFAITRLGEINRTEASLSGDQFANFLVQLTASERRNTRNVDFIDAWRARIVSPPGIESLTLVERRGGPPGRDIAVSLSGDDTDAIKAAALELASVLATVPGVSGIEDDMPFGQEQLIYRLTPQASALGLTVAEVGKQLRAAYDGYIAQIFQHEGEEIEVRVVLPDRERYHPASLNNFAIALPEGGSMPLLTAVDIEPRRGFDVLRHHNGRLSVQVSADVDTALNNSNAVIADLRAGALPEIAGKYGIEWTLEGRQADQDETLNDLIWGAGLALALIYLVLAFVFASYGWPLVVMSVIPFALIGAILGHGLLNIDLTILSLFGFFGLAGIVVNDSIIVVTFYKTLKESGMPWRAAIVEAACRRLRAVLLTSLTTIGGLTPIMFETSLQAQFLIPMAVSISFGLMISTLLVLLLLPALLCLHEAVATRWERPLPPEILPISSR